MQDYSYPSVFLSYFMFLIIMGLSLFFLIRSWRHGYWGKQSEEVKYRMMDDES